MNARSLGAASIGALAACLTVATTLAATPAPPDPARLRAVLADPIDQAFLEVTTSSPGWLVGQFDAKTYIDSFTDRDAQTRQSALDSLVREGFVSGYEREWYKVGGQDWLGELLLVFQNSTGAGSMAEGSKAGYAQDAGFKNFVTASAIPDAYALTEASLGRQWTVVIFTKGNDLFAVVGGSSSDYTTASTLAQAGKQFQAAPATISVAGPSAPRVRSPLVIAGIVGASAAAIGGLAAMILIVALWSRSRRPNTRQISPDGNYWWDGAAWRQVPRT